jgi:hypothetical protein
MKSLSKNNIIITSKNDIIVSWCYEITVHNKNDQSHNINRTHPTFFTTAFCDAEAIGKMMLSEWPHKIHSIYRIDKY